MLPLLTKLLQSDWGRDSEWRSAAHPSDVARAGERFELPEAVRSLLSEVNGLEAPDGLFRIFGLSAELPRHMRLDLRNGDQGWMRYYSRLARGLVFVAEDAFGNQFAWEQDGRRVVHFDGETGRRVPLTAEDAPALDFLDPVLADPGRWIQSGTFEGYMEAGGDLGMGELIGYKLALCLGGRALFGNMVPRRIETALCLNGQLALALADLPEGTPIEGVELARPPGG